MESNEQVYQLPASTGKEVRIMMIGLAWFFSITLVLAVLFIIYAPSILGLVPFSAEKNFVRPYEEMAERWWGGQTYPEIDEYLQQLAGDLSAAMDLPEDMEVQMHYVDSGEVNAFAMLGGHVFVTRGLFESVEDENSLSMVIAHEIAHQKHRDPITSMSRGIAVQMIYSLVTSDYSRMDLSAFGGELGLLYFSRTQEEKADEAAISALNAHYGHIAGYDQFFKGVAKMEGDQDAELPEWLSSHPDTQIRIEQLNELRIKNGWVKEQTHPIPDTVLALIHEEQEAPL